MTMKPATPSILSFLFVLINIVPPVFSQDIPPGSPSITGPDVIVRGENIVLSCSSTGGSPAPTVKWFRDDQEITTGVSSSTSGSTVTTTYTFIATLNEHYEVFECQAENGVLQNPLKTTKFVYVHYTPDLPVFNGPTDLVAGNPGTWTCTSSNGYPAGTMTIKNTNTGVTFTSPEYSSVSTPVNGGRSFTVTGTLNWSPALSNNGNQLCCEVAHPTTISTPQSVCKTLNVREQLAINAPIKSYTPTIGTSVTLQCVVTSGNPTIISWYKGNTQLNPATDSRYTNGNVNTPSLTINSVVQSDAGDYTCRANDGFVSVNTDNINVNPQGTPPVVTIPVNSYTQTVGNSITMVCQVSSPNSALQRVQWIFTNQNNAVTDPIDTSTAKYTGSTTTNPSLTVNNVQFSDEGTYRCRATNLIGTTLSAETTYLDVQGTIPVLNIPQDTYTAVYGQQLVIDCTIQSANPSVTNIYWTRQSGGNTVTINNGDGGYQGSTPQTPALTINFVTTAHTGTYRCHGTNVVGTGSSNQAAVTITGGLLTINQSPSSANVLQGSATTIQCIVSGTPTATSITWLFTPNGGTQGVLNKVVSKHTGGTTNNPSLTINNFQSTDAGIYTCQAQNAAGTTTSSTSTTLTFMQQLQLTISPADGTAIVGDNTYSINCQITGIPSPTSTSWFKRPTNGGQQTTITAGNKYTITANTNNPVLVINNIAETDEADYFCTATNLAGTVTSSRARLVVNGGLNTIAISPQSDNVIQGTNKLITCTVTGQPSPTQIRWYFTSSGSNSRQQLFISTSNGKYTGGTPSNPSMTVNNFQSGDAGSYQCEATNAAGTVTSGNSVLSYLGILSVTIQPSSQQATIGDASVTIQCTIQGTPQATSWEWTKTVSGGNPVVISQGTNNGKLQVANSATNPNLVIFNVVSDDAAEYRCRANNGAGLITSSPSTLTVQGTLPSINVEPSQYTATVGDDSFQFQCFVSAVPQASSWYWTFQPSGGGAAVTISQGTNNLQYMVDNSPSNPHLTIKEIALNEAGQYFCHATNAVGSRQSTAATLLVTGGILNVNISPASANVVRGNSQQILCIISGTPTAEQIRWFFTATGSSEQQLSITSSNGKYSGGTVGTPHLTISNFQNSDAGSYRCEAVNAAGTGTSPSSVLTYVENLNLQVNPAEGQAVLGAATFVFQCQITGSPQATTWRWIKNPGQNNAETIQKGTNSQKYSVLESATNPQLTIKNIAQSDDAFYRCEATNAAGTRQSASARLIVTGQLPAISVNPLQQFPQYGASSVTISCTVTASPSADTVGWRKITVDSSSTTNIDAPNSNGKYSVANSVTNPDLTINNVVFTDDANYQCYATNAVGTGNSALARVDVQGSRPQVTIPSSSFTAVYGNDITIPCQITGANPGVTAVTWYKVNNQQVSTINIGDPASYSGGTVATPALTIRNVNNADGGFYRCTATNQVGTGQSSDAQLLIQGGIPTVALSKTTESVVFGETVTFICTISSQLPAVTRVFWQFTRNSQTTQIDVSTSQGKYTGSTVSDPSLTVHNAAFTDEGSYQCFAENVVGIGQSDALVLGISGGLLTVTVPKSTYTVLIDNTVSLQCSVTGLPSATEVYWEKRGINNNFIRVDPTSNNRYSGGNLNNPTLAISSSKFEDEGVYRCVGVNAAGRAESIETTLDVTGSKPVVNVASIQYSVNIGNSITLQCNVQSNPLHTNVKWQKIDGNGNAVDVDMTNNRYTGSKVNSPSLIISNTISSDQGGYICLATNIVGTGQSRQTFLTVVGSIPTVTVPTPTYSVNTGSTITLECSYSANPQATQVRWEKTVSGNTVDIGDTTTNNKYGGSTLGSPSLIIYNAAESDEGSYRCKVSNAVGTGISSTSTTLDVIGNVPIVTVPTGAYTVNVGESKTLTCEVTSDPAHTNVYWQKVSGGQTITIDTNLAKYGGSTISSPSLVINNAAFSDSGTYYCFATNAVGTGQSTQVVLAVAGTTPSVSLTNTNVQANYGNSVTLGCVVSANPAATSVYWQKIVGNQSPITIDTSNTAKYSGGTVGNPSLQISNVNTNDEASYICFAANSVGTGQSERGTLNVIGSPPVVTIPEASYTINIGNTITIACSIQSNPAHNSVYWTRKIGNNQEEQISTTGSASSKYSGSTVQSPSLVIYNVQMSDAGQYNCHATNIVGTGKANTPTNLRVVGNVPTVTASIPSSVRIGTSITIDCSVDANPAATQIIWQFVTNNAASNIDISGNSRFSGGSVANPDLTISPVQESDEGTYRCQAVNSEGTGTSNTVYLDATGDPPINVVINPSPLTVEEGQTISTTCSAQGTPAPSYEWRKFGSNTVIASGATLSIANAKESDATSYTCTASNSFGSNTASVNVDVQYRPKVRITNHPITGKLAQSVTIQCAFTSNPFANKVQWKKVVGGVNTNINIDGNKYQGGTLTSPSLTIFNLGASDQGDYICTVTNSVGTGNSNTGSLTVDMRTSPMGIQIFPGQITVLEGNDFSIYCNATANPSPSYEWYHKDVKVGTGQTLTIKNSEWTPHDGLYTCKAENEIGYQEATIDVDVKYTPVNAVAENTFTPALNSPITLTCNTKANPSAIAWKWFQNGYEIVGQTEKTLSIDMDSIQDVGQYHCVAYNEVGHSPNILFTVSLPVSTSSTTTTVGPNTGAAVASAGGLTGGEIAAICLGILFFVLLLIVLIACCVLQGCCAWCCGAGAAEKDRRITPDPKVSIPQFYEVPTVVTREPSLISKRDVSLHMAPVYSGRPSNEYEITKYRVIRPEYEVDERYVTTAARPYYLPAIEYTYDEEERRRRRRKKKRSRRHDELRGDEQIVLEERVVDDGFRTGSRYSDVEVEEVVTGPVYRFDPE